LLTIAGQEEKSEEQVKNLGSMKKKPAQWILMGCGYLKLNKEKDGSAKARLLLREDCGRHPTKIRDVILNSNVGSLFNYFQL